MLKLIGQFSSLLWSLAFGLLASALFAWFMNDYPPLIIFGIRHYPQMEISMAIVACIVMVRIAQK